MITILDGPLGTELDARGVETDNRAWSAHAIDSAPDVIALIHRQYAQAGATIHTANTFRTKRRSVGSDWARMAAAAVQIAKSNVPASHRVAGSIAPLEDCYDPALSPGEASRPEHRELAEVLAASGADILLCETFAHVAEAVIAVEESVRTNVETWIAFTAGPKSNLMTEKEMAEAARRAVEAGASAVLVNCTPANQTLRFVDAIASAKLNVPIGAYANSGTDGWQSSADEHTSSYIADANRWIDVGATLIGGCCGTSPAQILQLSELAKGLR